MKRENIRHEWRKTLSALESAIDNQLKRRHDRASSEAYYAMEHAGRAALMVYGAKPTTHKAIINALENQPVGRGALSEELWARIDEARGTRFNVE